MTPQPHNQDSGGPSKPFANRPAKSTVIGTEWRVVSALLGFIGVAAGGWAVFKTSVEAGPVALLLLGAVFLLIAISARLPNVLKFGDNEIGWSEEAQEEIGGNLATAYENGGPLEKATFSELQLT